MVGSASGSSARSARATSCTRRASSDLSDAMARTWDPSVPGNGYWERIAATENVHRPAKPFVEQRLMPSPDTLRAKKLERLTGEGRLHFKRLPDGRREVKCPNCDKRY